MGWNVRGPDDLSEDERARIRYQVLSSLRGKDTTAADRAYDVFALLALPAPHLMRAVVVFGVLLAIVATATVASAGALPDDALYPVKLAGEQMRLALALTPEDRAAVELSMAEHRLAEAEQLALDGRTDEALVATSSYGEHLANAAASLATVERLEPSVSAVVDRLRQRLSDQQKRAGEIAARVATEPSSARAAPVFRSIASLAPLAAGSVPLSALIAEHAAEITDRIAKEAERIAQSGPAAAPRATAVAARPVATATPQPTRTPTRTEAPRPVGAGQPQRTLPPQATAAPQATAEPSAQPAATPDRAAQNAAEKARRDAEKAREAAEKAKEAGKKSPSPSPVPSPKR